MTDYTTTPVRLVDLEVGSHYWFKQGGNKLTLCTILAPREEMTGPLIRLLGLNQDLPLGIVPEDVQFWGPISCPKA